MMNDCQNTGTRPPYLLTNTRLASVTRAVIRPVRHGVLLLLVALLLAACWGNDEPAPASAEPPVSALPTTGAAANGAETPTEEDSSNEAATDTSTGTTAEATGATTETTAGEAAAGGIAALAETPSASETSTTSPTVAEPAASPTPTFVPLAVEASDDCEVASSLDLAGYPNLEETMGCATEPAIFDPIAINEFGDAEPTDRFMLWFSHEAAIYVLMPDGTYETHEDTWNEETDPTYPCNPLGGEEDSPPLPRRGFGKLWCENPELQEIMGAVPREERLCQYAVLQRFETGRLLACFEDATIRYFRILDDGTWDLQVQ